MKKVIITGTSKGIGLETALAFGRAGYKVFATLRNPDSATVLKQKIKEEKLDIGISVMDVDSDESVKRCMATLMELHGPIDVLVNNAGIERHGSVEELPLPDFKAIMETNYFGVIRCIKAILPQMRERKQGCIINVASVAGHIASSPLGGYAASKFALEAVSEALAQEVKSHNVRVAIVEPGIINTKMAQDIKQPGPSIYPQIFRFSGLFAASLETPTPPSLVADKILEIANTNTWKLRHPVGPDAAPFLEWRANMSDEEWVNWNAMGDEEWYEAVERDFGLNARKNLSNKTTA